MAGGVVLKIILLVFIVKTSVAQYSCLENKKYHMLGICVIENVIVPNIDQATFPNETHLEFLRPQIPSFDVEIFKRLPDTKHLELRNGFVADVLFWSPVIETLRVIHTDLFILEALSEPNYSLKQLTIRSPVYSRWSTSLKALKALERIDISHCNFSYVNLDWFAGYKNLRSLSLSDNKLHSVHVPPFLRMNTLKELYLAGNRLEFLWRFPDAFPQLEMLNLNDNRWICDWVTMARGAIFLQGMVSMGSDFSCPDGWENNGGLCCKPRDFVERKSRPKKVRPVPCTISVVEEEKGSDDDANGRVVEMEFDNSVVVLTNGV